MGEKINKDGTARRKPTDNRVVESGGKNFYKGQNIEFDDISKKWILNGQTVGSISNLSQSLRPLVNETQFDLTTYAIGEHLERNGYTFVKPFM